MDKKKRYLFIVNTIISAIAIAFIGAALGTEYWIIADLQRIVDDDVLNATGEDAGDKFTGDFHAGLFSGEKYIDYGYGLRYHTVEVQCDASDNVCLYEDQNDVDSTNCINSEENMDEYLFSFALWLCTIISAVIAISWGIVAIGFSVLNASRRPIEVITGPMGLYLWNSLAATFCLLCIILYVVLFETDLNNNVLEPCDIRDRWTSKGRAQLDYSFYFIVISAVLFLINICVMGLSGVECRRKKSFAATMSTKALEGVMMY